MYKLVTLRDEPKNSAQYHYRAGIQRAWTDLDDRAVAVYDAESQLDRRYSYRRRPALIPKSYRTDENEVRIEMIRKKKKLM